MNKFLKYTGAAATLVGLTCLLHTRQTKSDVTYVKHYLITSKQLINRLIEQLKDTKGALLNLTHGIKGVDVNGIKQHANKSANQLQSKINKLQKSINQIKNN